MLPQRAAMRSGSNKGNKGAVAAGHPLTVAAASDVLREGGNALDAAVAGLWMACVCEPVLASPGGGGFMMLLPPSARQAELIDFFVHTPSRTPNEAELDFHAVHADFGTTQQQFHVGAGATAVPGFVPGLLAAHDAFGRMPMRELAAPAIEAAKKGVEITAFQAKLFSIVAPILVHSKSARALFAPDGHLLEAGATLNNPALADVIEAIALEGVRIATVGEIAAAMERSALGGGALQHGDIGRYQVERRNPLTKTVVRASLYLNPAPSCGGLLIAAMMDALARPSPEVPIVEMAQAMAKVDLAWRNADGNPARFAEMADRDLVRSRGTTHISVVDAEGFAVSATVSNGEGNGLIVPGCGFMLNNMLGEEDLNPAGFHRWRADQRLSSMMAPSILRDADGGVTAFGSGGSNRIRTALFQTAARLSHGSSGPLDDLVAWPRVHVEAGHLHFEDLFTEEERSALCSLFPEHTIWAEPSMFFGGVHIVARSAKGTYQAAGDQRRDGRGVLA